MSDFATHVVEVNDLEVSFQTHSNIVRAVRGASVTVKPGEAVGLVGESGSGKSTLARAIMGLLPRNRGRVTGGTISIQGRLVSELPEAERVKLRGNPVAMVFQDPLTYLNPVKKIGRQIAESVLLHERDSNVSRRVKELLNLVLLPSSCYDAYPHQLSGGMQQRALLAIALGCKPAILIADEPTTALDVTTQAEIIELISGLRQELRMALLLISHDIALIAQSCDRVTVMYAGRTIESGPVLEVLRYPAHWYTRGLIAASIAVPNENGRFASIPGELASNASEIQGCSFRNRCEEAAEECKELQEARVIKHDHTAHCCRPSRMKILAC